MQSKQKAPAADLSSTAALDGGIEMAAENESITTSPLCEQASSALARSGYQETSRGRAGLWKTLYHGASSRTRPSDHAWF